MSQERYLSLPLLLGMFTIWPLACWLFLRRGYSRSLRQAVLFYCIANVVLDIGSGL